jgi:uncharacterized integral membrane protein
MQIVRTILWVLLAVVLVLFAVNNWQPVEVRIWQSLILETKLPALVIGAFLLGLVPTWLVHRVSLWRHRRRIATLESGLLRQPVVVESAPPVTPLAAEPPPAA